MLKKWDLIFSVVFLALAIAIFLIVRTFIDIFWNHKISTAELSWIMAEIQIANDKKEKQIQENIIEEKKQINKESDIIKVKDNSKYPQANITVKIWTWTILFESTSKAPHEISYFQDEEAKQNWWKISTVTWYIYTYIYYDLWLKITTSAAYETGFFEKANRPLITRNGNIIYNVALGNDIIWWDYIEVFFKDPKKSFEDEIKENQLPSWATISTWIAVDHPMSSHIKWFLVINIISADGNIYWWTDKQLPSNMNWISFYMNPQKPDRYYKFSYADCAPGPCSIFGDIEFF